MQFKPCLEALEDRWVPAYIAGDIPGQGISIYNTFSGNYSFAPNPTGTDPSGIDADAIGDVVATFGNNGTWVYSSQTGQWKEFDFYGADQVRMAGAGLVAGVWSNGLWTYDVANGQWNQLTPYAPTDFDIDNSGDVVGNWSGWGTAVYSVQSNSWNHFDWNEGSQIRINDGKVAGVWSDGLWTYNTNNGAWNQLTPYSPTDFDVDAQGDVVGNFSGWGVNLYSAANNSWTQIDTYDATQVDISDDGLVSAEFPGWGMDTYNYISGGWQSNQALMNPDPYNDVVMGSF
jgi:hypothetical protein